MKRKSILLLILAIVYIMSMMLYFFAGVLEAGSRGGPERWGLLNIYWRLTLPGSLVSLVSLVLPWRDSDLLLFALAPILNVLLAILIVRLWRLRSQQVSTHK